MIIDNPTKDSSYMLSLSIKLISNLTKTLKQGLNLDRGLLDSHPTDRIENSPTES
jgi:hypothetical protein